MTSKEIFKRIEEVIERKGIVKRDISRRLSMIRKINKKYRYSKPVKPLVIKGIICTWNFTTTGRLFVEG